MAFARINFHPSGDVSSVEVGLECVDDPAVLPPLVLNAAKRVSSLAANSLETLLWHCCRLTVNQRFTPRCRQELAYARISGQAGPTVPLTPGYVKGLRR